MKIQQIYDQYKIMPQLQLHQLRVAAVASLIADNFQEKIDKHAIVVAALLHDMGNIIKFDLTIFPENVEPKGLDYWHKIKQGFINKYGNDEHDATIQIIKELLISKNIIELIRDLEFSNTLKIADSNNIGRKILKYADLRVTPSGVDSLRNRLGEAKTRYVQKKGKWTAEEFDKFSDAWEKAEKQIFLECKITPEDINEQSIKPYLAKMDDYEIR